MMKKKFSLISMFLVLMFVFNIFSVRTSAESNSDSITFVAAKEKYDINFSITNHDSKTLISTTIRLLDSAGNTVYEKTLRPADLSYYPEYGYETYSINTVKNLTIGESYTLVCESESNYKTDITFRYNDSGQIYVNNTCLERFFLVKSWIDNNNADRKRPTAEEFIQYLSFKEDGVEVEPEIIISDHCYRYGDMEAEIDENINYTYRIYGMNITKRLDIYEDVVTEYESLNNYTANIGADGSNTTRPSLVNRLVNEFDIELIKVDKTDAEKKLANVEFEIYNITGESIKLKNGDVIENDGLIATIVTDENGYAKYDDLPKSGKYRIVETANPNDGYGDPAWQKEFDFGDAKIIDGRSKALLDFGKVTNEAFEYANLKIIKVDAEDQSIRLPEATFELYNDSDKQITLKNGTIVEAKGLIDTYTTDANGEISIDKILPNDAVYRLVETVAPAEYVIDSMNSETRNIVLSALQDNEVTVKNNSVYAGIKIIKVDNSAVWYGGEKAYLKGAVFTIINDSDETIVLKDGTSVGPQEVIGEYESDENGIASTGLILPRQGKYKISEIKSPENYDVSKWYYPSNYYIIDGIEDGGYIEKEIVNFRATDYICLNKTIMNDDFNAIVEEHTFTYKITMKDENGQPVNGRYYVTDDSMKASSPELYHDQESDNPYVEFVDGVGTIDVKNGERLYICDISNKYDISVEELPDEDYFLLYSNVDPSRTYRFSSMGNSLYGSYYNGAYPENEEFVIEADKQLIGKELEDGEFTFELYDSNDELIATAVNDPDGKIEFDPITIDRTKLKPKKLLYSQATDEQKQNIPNWYYNPPMSSDSLYICTKNIPGDATNWDDKKYSEVDESTKANYRSTWQVNVTTEGGKQQRYCLYDTNYKDIPGTAYSYIFEEELDYYIREKVDESDPKMKYDDHKEDIKVRITTDLENNKLVAEVEYDNDGAVFENEYDNKKEIEISKTDLGGKELPGAKIQIKDQDGNTVESWTSTSVPKKIKINPGKYVFHEVAAPSGYLKVTDISFEVNEDGQVIVTAVDGVVKAEGSRLIVIDKKKPDKPEYEIPKTGIR